MTPKEKAQELYDKIHFVLPSYHDEGQQEHAAAKECALIAVDEIIGTLNHDIRDLDVRGSVLLDLIKYWEQVKQEMQKL